MCWVCWDDMYNNRVPTTLVTPDEEKCCFCGLGTRSGIYVRHDPNDPILECQGRHGDEAV